MAALPGSPAWSTPSRFAIACCLGMINKEMHPVKKVHFAYTGICIQEEEVELWVLLFHPFLYPFRDDMVGNTSERLQTQYIVYAILEKGDDFTSDQPAFTILMVQAEDFLGAPGDIENIMMGMVASVFLHNLVECPQETVDQLPPQEGQQIQNVRVPEICLHRLRVV